MKACVIGAGPSGLATGKVLLADGFDVTVLEQQEQVGGIWSKGGCYAGLHTQSTTPLFEFADLPSGLDMAPAHAVQSYLEGYAAKFGVLERVRTGEEVVSVSPLPGPGTPGAAGWRVESRSSITGVGGSRSGDFDCVVVASGAYRIPDIPDIPGLGEFKGKVLHSNQVCEHDLAGMRVVVVGGSKSALDLAVRASRQSVAAMLVQRRVNWMVPERFFFGTVPYKWLLFSRLGETLLPLYHDKPTVRLPDRLPESVKKAIWRLVCKNIVHETGLCHLPSELRPQKRLPHGIARAGVMPRGYADAVRAGRLSVAVSEVSEFHEHGLTLAAGRNVDADVVIFATGHRREFPFLDQSVQVLDDAGRLQLYKGMVPTDVVNLGFVGFRNIFNNLLGMGICAHWLSAKFRNRFESSPSSEEMRAAVERRLSWQEKALPGSGGYDFGPYSLHTVDELLLDLGVRPERARNMLAEFLAPASASDRYAVLESELRVARPRHGSTG